jgi:Rrf2 family iron-sulfur cluster assembly transcriptional regulator
MKLSTKGRYAVTAMMHLALHDKKGSLPLADLSESQGISQSYLEQLFARLRSAGLVRGTRGPGGGYRLARPAGDISIADIISAVDDAGAEPGPEQAVGRETDELWYNLSQQLHDFLAGIKLSQFVAEPHRPRATRRRDSLYGWGFVPREEGHVGGLMM